MYNILLYLLSLIVVTYAMDSVNISVIFKKNKEYQAKLFYILLIFSMSYLVVSFLKGFLGV